MKRKFILSFVFLIIFSSFQAFAAPYSPQVLTEILSQVKNVRSQNGAPLIFFDLDDTLINARERNVRVFKDFAAQTALQYPEESKRLAAISEDEIVYSIDLTLQNAGIEKNSVDFIKLAKKFWWNNFFTNKYCATDDPVCGAVEYVHLLAAAGSQNVYLTGRDVPRMWQGTVENLRDKNHFPFAPDRGLEDQLILDQDRGNTLQFKLKAIQTYVEAHPNETLLVFFENEPKNLNAMLEKFPAAIGVLLDTAHSFEDQPEILNPRIYQIKDFRNCEMYLRAK